MGGSVDFVRQVCSSTGLTSQRRLLELPPMPVPTPRVAALGVPECCVQSYSACQSQQWCSELPIEGCVQGAFTWAWVKAFTAGHLDTTVHQHVKAMHNILSNLKQHFRYLDQTLVVQLSGSAREQDRVL